MFVAPLAFDQFDNAYHVERLGLGLSRPFRSLTSRHLARALDELGTSRYQLRGMEIRSQLQNENGLERTVNELVQKLDLGIKTHESQWAEVGV